MKYSVLTPCYNAARFIVPAAQSLYEQEFSDWEHIFVNDGSKDDTLIVLGNLAKEDSRIRVIDQPNGGVSVSRNRGMDEARGEWIISLDQDDALLPGALNDIDRLVSSFPEANCFVFPYCTKDGNGRIQDCTAPIFRDFGNRCFSGPEAFRLLYSDRKYRGQHWQPWRFVFRKDSIPHFRPGVIHEDLDELPFHIAGLPTVCIAGAPFYLYSTNYSRSATHRFTVARVRDICDITTRLYQEMDRIIAGQSSLQLSNEVLTGFKSLLAYNLFGFYLASASFAEPERSECFAFFQAHKDWLLAIGDPPFRSVIKRFFLRCLGVKGTAILIHRIVLPKSPDSASQRE